MDINQLIQEYHPMIYKICRVYSDEYDFDDLYQEISINLWKGLKRYEGKSKLSTWAYRVALNTALTYQRNNSKHRNKTPLSESMVAASSSDEAAEKERRVQRLFDAVRQLEKVDRSVMLLYLEEKKYDEIAEITGLSASNVGVKISRAKKQLRKLLEGQI